MFFSKPAGHKIINRGDFTPKDYTLEDFTLGEWATLDLSEIIPIGTFVVLLLIAFKADNENTSIYFKETGVVNDDNMVSLNQYSVQTGFSGQVLIFCNNNRQIDYCTSTGGTFSIINLSVSGWVKK